MVYSSVEHFSATAAWPPASGLMYQVSSGVPLSPLHAASRLLARASAGHRAGDPTSPWATAWSGR